MDMEAVTATGLTALAEESLTNEGSRSRDILAAVAGQRRRVEEAAARWLALAGVTRWSASPGD
jgi:hypothetical protein